LSASPGRIDPANPAFNASRKPLVGEFMFNGQKIFVIANHFNAKGGDQPLFGRFQPPARSSEIQRVQQATIVANFVRSLRQAQADANIAVLGDLNDFQFSDTVQRLKDAGLVDMVETLPEEERYSYVFEGNSQVLDHILLSQSLVSRALPQYDVVHVNSEFADQASDHDPEVVKLLLPLADLSGQIAVQRSGLVFNRATQAFVGNVQLTNVGAGGISAPLQLVFESLTGGVTLANASGTRNGSPYITLPQSLPAGETVQIAVQFANPARVPVNYTLRVYSAEF
jgi:uncharacterized protein